MLTQERGQGVCEDHSLQMTNESYSLTGHEGSSIRSIVHDNPFPQKRSLAAQSEDKPRIVSYTKVTLESDASPSNDRALDRPLLSSFREMNRLDYIAQDKGNSPSSGLNVLPKPIGKVKLVINTNPKAPEDLHIEVDEKVIRMESILAELKA